MRFSFSLNLIWFHYAAWSTMFHMCTMPCMPILTGTTLPLRVLPSKIPELHQISISREFNFLKINRVCGLFCSRFFKESSEEEREHAEKLMEYQVLGYIK